MPSRSMSETCDFFAGRTFYFGAFGARGVDLAGETVGAGAPDKIGVVAETVRGEVFYISACLLVICQKGFLGRGCIERWRLTDDLC